MDLPKFIFEEEPSSPFNRKNIATFLVIGILILSIPFGLKLAQTQQQLKSQASTGGSCVLTDHAPLQDTSYYREIKDTDEGACVCPGGGSGNCSEPKVKASKPNDPACARREDCDYVGSRYCGFVWSPKDKMHLQLWNTSKLTAQNCADVVNNPEADKSYCAPAYYDVIDNPRFAEAIAAIDLAFHLDQVNYKTAINVPGLGRGDERVFDPAWRVASFLNATSGSYWTQLNPNKIHDPVEYMYDRGFWGRPDGKSSAGKGAQEEYYLHWINTINAGKFGEQDGNKSLIDVVTAQNRRGKNWSSVVCQGAAPPSPPPSAPTVDNTIRTPQASCSVDGKLEIKWPAVSGATKYGVRIDDTINGWGGYTGQEGDYIHDSYPVNTISLDLGKANHAYNWWVAPFEGNTIKETSAKGFVVCPVAGKVCAQSITNIRNNLTRECAEIANACVPDGWTKDDTCKSGNDPNVADLPSPTVMNVSCDPSGTKATLSWEKVLGAASYQHRIDKEPGTSPWAPQTANSGDSTPTSVGTATSIEVPISANTKYAWILQALPAGKTSQTYGPEKSREMVEFTCEPGKTEKVVSCDFNGDKKYDDKDYDIWKREFTRQVATTKADCNSDGSVDLADFNKWRTERYNSE